MGFPNDLNGELETVKGAHLVPPGLGGSGGGGWKHKHSPWCRNRGFILALCGTPTLDQGAMKAAVRPTISPGRFQDFGSPFETQPRSCDVNARRTDKINMCGAGDLAAEADDYLGRMIEGCSMFSSPRPHGGVDPSLSWKVPTDRYAIPFFQTVRYPGTRFEV